MHEHYEDCPRREQAMYILDCRNEIRCSYYVFHNIEFIESSILLMVDGQKENDLFDLRFPSDINITIPYFSLTITSIIYEYMVFTKNYKFVKKVLPCLIKMMKYFISRINGNGLFKTIDNDGLWHFYEWTKNLDGAFYDAKGKMIRRDEYDVIINAFLSIALQDCMKIFF